MCCNVTRELIWAYTKRPSGIELALPLMPLRSPLAFPLQEGYFALSAFASVRAGLAPYSTGQLLAFEQQHSCEALLSVAVQEEEEPSSLKKQAPVVASM